MSHMISEHPVFPTVRIVHWQNMALSLSVCNFSQRASVFLIAWILPPFQSSYVQLGKRKATVSPFSYFLIFV